MDRVVYLVICHYEDGGIRFDCAFTDEDDAIDYADACMSERYGEPIIDTKVKPIVLKG